MATHIAHPFALDIRAEFCIFTDRAKKYLCFTRRPHTLEASSN